MQTVKLVKLSKNRHIITGTKRHYTANYIIFYIIAKQNQKQWCLQTITNAISIRLQYYTYLYNGRSISKAIKGYETLYEISNLGRVKNLTSDKILKNNLIKVHREYYVIQLRNKKSMKRIHVLIAEAFIPNPKNKPKVDHIDRDRTNNNIDNLRWITLSEYLMKSEYSGVSSN